MARRGLVSTIVPVYNRPGLLREAVASVLAQTYRPLEVIIVDDGSTDETVGVADALAAEADVVRVIRLAHQGRAGLVREAGRQLAEGEFIQYLDSDDLLAPRKFELMVGGLESDPDAEVAYCATRRYAIGDVPLDVATERTGERFRHLPPEFLSRRFWHTSTPIYRRRLCDRIGPWSDLMFWEDIEYDLRVAALSVTIHYRPEFLTDFRDHSLGRLSRAGIHQDPKLLAEAVRGYQLLAGHVRRWRLAPDSQPAQDFIEDLRFVAGQCRKLGLERELASCLAIIRQLTGDGSVAILEEPTLEARIEPLASAISARSAEVIKLPVRIENRSNTSFRQSDFLTFGLSYHLLSSDGTMIRWDQPRVRFSTPLRPGDSRQMELPINAPAEAGRYLVEVDLVCERVNWFSKAGNPTPRVPLEVHEGGRSAALFRPPVWRQRPAAILARAGGAVRRRAQRTRSRWRMANGITPLSQAWGTDRGQPIHRHYVEEFLHEFRADIRGNCLEFQDPQYVPRFGGSAVSRLDILHIDDSNPRATLVADLTRPNDLPAGRFDCIVCTHVLHVIFDFRRAIAELHRLLRPGGVLLVAVPHVSMWGAQYDELWRFTPAGLRAALAEAFGADGVTIRAYGNSLAAAAEIRGLVADELTAAQLDTRDDRFAVEVCGRAVRG
jgi:hypothetical protein